MVYRASQSGAGRARVRGREVAGEGKVVAVAVIGERALDPAAAGLKIHGYAPGLPAAGCAPSFARHGSDRRHGRQEAAMTIARGCEARDPRRPARLLQTNRQQFSPGERAPRCVGSPQAGLDRCPVAWQRRSTSAGSSTNSPPPRQLFTAPVPRPGGSTPAASSTPCCGRSSLRRGPPVPTGGRSTRWE